MPFCLAELPCVAAVCIYWTFSQPLCCTWLEPELKLNAGWAVLRRTVIVPRNHKVGLDGSLKEQAALLCSSPFEALFALARLSMSLPGWLCRTNGSCAARLAAPKKEAGLLAAHQSPSRLDSYALMKRTDQLLGGQSASPADGPECGQPAKRLHTCRRRDCMYGCNKWGSFQFGKGCPNERLSTRTKSLKRDFLRRGDALGCSEGGSVLPLLLSACCFAGYIINKGGCLVFESRHSCYYNREIGKQRFTAVNPFANLFEARSLPGCSLLQWVQWKSVRAMLFFWS